MKVFTNCRLFDPYTDAVYENVSFSVLESENKEDNGRILDIFFGNDEKPQFPENAERIDLGGKIVIPGFIDAHVHCESTLLVPSHTTFLAQRGTVVCVADPHEITNVLGEDGFNFFVEDSKKAVVDFRFTIPSCVPATDFETAGAKITPEIVERVLARDEEVARQRQRECSFLSNGHHVAGLGEVMNLPGVLDKGCENLQGIMRVCRERQAHMDGHSPGALGTVLNQYIAAGIETDHECTEPIELLSRLRRGMNVLIREGTACKNAVKLCTALKDLPRAATHQCAFCTDDRRIDDILEDGHIDNAVRIGIKCGINKYDAVRMATLNPAQMFHLVDYGAIAPGKIASFSVLEGEIEDCKIERVFIRGKELDTKHSTEEKLNLAGQRTNVMNVDIDKINKQIDDAKFSGPAIGIIPNQIVTHQEEATDKSHMLVCIERYTGKCEMGHCFINGVQINDNCAVASTVAHDSHNIVCVGSSKQAMKDAISALVKANGGYSCANNGKVTVLPLPVAGLMTDKTKEELLEELKVFRQALLDAGAWTEYDLMMTISFMCLPVIPKLKLTNKGLFDAEVFQFVKQ